METGGREHLEGQGTNVAMAWSLCMKNVDYSVSFSESGNTRVSYLDELVALLWNVDAN